MLDERVTRDEPLGRLAGGEHGHGAGPVGERAERQQLAAPHELRVPSLVPGEQLGRPGKVAALVEQDVPLRLCHVRRPSRAARSVPTERGRGAPLLHCPPRGQPEPRGSAAARDRRSVPGHVDVTIPIGKLHNGGMRLSARADYALRAAIELAAAQDGHVTAEQLAQAQNIPGKFLETILTHLRRSNIVRSQRGPDGGFWLARPAAEISLADIIRAIDGQLLGVRGERPENVSYPGAAEPLQRVWIALRANERAVLETVTLADIVSGELPPAVAVLTDSPQAWV